MLRGGIEQGPVGVGVEVERAALTPEFDQRAVGVEQLLEAGMVKRGRPVPERQARGGQNLGLDADQGMGGGFRGRERRDESVAAQPEPAHLIGGDGGTFSGGHAGFPFPGWIVPNG